jgi:hypothetical protein
MNLQRIKLNKSLKILAVVIITTLGLFSIFRKSFFDILYIKLGIKFFLWSSDINICWTFDTHSKSKNGKRETNFQR